MLHILRWNMHVFHILLEVSDYVTFKNCYLEFLTNLNLHRIILDIHHKKHILDSFIQMEQNGLIDREPRRHLCDT